MSDLPKDPQDFAAKADVAKQAQNQATDHAADQAADRAADRAATAQPSDTTAKTPADAPPEASDNASTEISADAPNEAPADATGNSNNAAEVSAAAPADAPPEASDNASTEISADAPNEAPADATGNSDSAADASADAVEAVSKLPAATNADVPAVSATGAAPAEVGPAQATSASLPAEAPAPTEKSKEPGKPMTLMEHLDELRVRLMRCAIAVGLSFFFCWAVVDPIFDALVNPLLKVLPSNSTAIYTTLPEGFFTRMYIAFVTGVFVSSPILFYQVWSFIAPGLYDDEKRFIVPVAITSGLFFICGGAFCYFVVFPYAFSFFVSFSTDTVVTMPRVSDYLDFVLKLLLAFGLIFEMPLFAFFLARMGIVTADMMRAARRYAVLVIFIVAAILTPPDVVSQLLMACPMLLLYELSILVAATFGRKKKPAPDAKNDDNPEKTEKAEAA